MRGEGIDPHTDDEVRIASPPACKPDERQGARETIAFGLYEHTCDTKGCGKLVGRPVTIHAVFTRVQAFELACDHAQRKDANHEQRHELGQNNLHHERQRGLRRGGRGNSIGRRSDGRSRRSGLLVAINGFQYTGSYQSFGIIRRDRGVARIFDGVSERGFELRRQRKIAIPWEIKEDGPVLHHAVVYACRKPIGHGTGA